MRTANEIELKSPTGLSRLLCAPEPDDLGHLVILGEAPFTHSSPVFMGWAPFDGSGLRDLISLVEFGHPGEIQYLRHICIKPKGIAHVLAIFEGARMSGTKSWFYRCELIDSLLTEAYGADDEDIIGEAPTPYQGAPLIEFLRPEPKNATRRNPTARKAKPARARSQRSNQNVGVSKPQQRSKKKATRR